MPKVKALLPLALVLLAGALYAPAASASSNQQSIIQDDDLLHADPATTLATFRELGVDRIRVTVAWAAIAPSPGAGHPPAGFNAANPADYPAANWAPYDAIVKDATAAGIAVYFNLTSPVPHWAEGPGQPPGGIGGVWNPFPPAFGQFVHALGTRYSGSYRPNGSAAPLPRVSFWSIWNEPNYGRALAPQTNGSGSVQLAAGEYRGLLAAAWGSLIGTGHRPGRDTILIGETAPRGSNGAPGQFGGIKPLTFLRALYCVDSRYRQLRGSAARAIGCPTTAGGARQFRSHNAALFQASGFADHPYTLQGHPAPPTAGTNFFGPGASDPNYADLPEIPRLEGVLNRLNAIYGSHKRFPIWNTEYGYRTRPPDHVGVSLATQAAWNNWAEFLSYKQRGIASFDQYLFQDPPSGVFATGLELPNGRLKPAFAAFRMPMYLPVNSTRRGHTLEVWGGVRPAHFAAPGQHVQIQFQAGSHGPFRTVRTVTITNPRGYFDMSVAFPGSGSVRLAWTQSQCPPATPGTVSCLVVGTVYSRTQRIRIH